MPCHSIPNYVQSFKSLAHLEVMLVNFPHLFSSSNSFFKNYPILVPKQPIFYLPLSPPPLALPLLYPNLLLPPDSPSMPLSLKIT